METDKLVCGVRVKGPWHPGVRTRGRSADGRTPHNAAALFLDASTPALGPQTHSKEVSAAQGNGVDNSRTGGRRSVLRPEGQWAPR